MNRSCSNSRSKELGDFVEFLDEDEGGVVLNLNPDGLKLKCEKRTKAPFFQYLRSFQNLHHMNKFHASPDIS
jgi:hypothetical protein